MRGVSSLLLRIACHARDDTAGSCAELVRRAIVATLARSRNLHARILRHVVGRGAVDEDAAAVDGDGDRLAAGQGIAVEHRRGADLRE